MARGEVCEYACCQSIDTEDETVHGHSLTLCERHSTGDNAFLPAWSYSQFCDWARVYLKASSFRRWPKEDGDV